MRLIKHITFKIGQITERIQSLLQSAKPRNVLQTYQIFETLEKNKQFIQYTSNLQGFITKAERIILKEKDVQLHQLFIIYQIMKDLQVITPMFRLSFFKKMKQKLLQDSLKKEHIQSMLWFLHRQAYYYHDMFLEAAENHTLVLFDIYEYMQNLSHLPKYQPYIRVVTMLRYLGHEAPLKKEILNYPTIQSISSDYLPILGSLISQQQAEKIKQQHTLYIPLKSKLTKKIIEQDRQKYLRYLHKIQQIDNTGPNQEIDRTFDVIAWNKICEIINLAKDASNEEIPDATIDYNISQLFWRKCETQDIDFENGARIISIFNQKQYQDEECLKISLRIGESILNTDMQSLRFVPARAIRVLFESLPVIQRVPSMKKDLFMKLAPRLQDVIVWDEGQKQLIKQILQKQEYKQQGVLKFLSE